VTLQGWDISEQALSTETFLQLSLPAVAESAHLARSEIAHLAAKSGATSGQIESVRVAVSEALTNAIVHAYPGTKGSVHVTAAVAGGELWVLVADEGRGFQTASKTPGLGWGMPLIAHMSDEFAILERSGGGTEVRMRFPLGETTIA